VAATPADSTWTAPSPHEKLICENCGSVVANDAVFCPECGRSTKAGVSPPTDAPPNLAAPVAATPADSTWTAPSVDTKRFCENCGSLVAADAVFCPECGRSIEAGVSPATHTALHLDSSATAAPAEPAWTAPAPEAPAKQFCENCGSPVAAGSEFCSNCGRSAQAGVSPLTAVAPPIASPAAFVPPPPRRSRWPVLAAALAGLLIALIAAGYYVYARLPRRAALAPKNVATAESAQTTA